MQQTEATGGVALFIVVGLVQGSGLLSEHEKGERWHPAALSGANRQTSLICLHQCPPATLPIPSVDTESFEDSVSLLFATSASGEPLRKLVTVASSCRGCTRPPFARAAQIAATGRTQWSWRAVVLPRASPVPYGWKGERLAGK